MGSKRNPRTKLRGTARNLLPLATALLVLPGGPALAQDTGTLDKDQVVEQPKPYSPYVDQHFPQRVLFGDMPPPYLVVRGQRLDREQKRPGRELPVGPG